MKKLTKKIKAQPISSAIADLPNRDSIFNELCSTSSKEASEGIILWIESSDCVKSSAEKILKACEDKLKK